MTLTLVSIGLNSHLDLSLKAIETAKQADIVYLETYTMKLETTPHQLNETLGRPIQSLSRRELEEEADKLLKVACGKDVVILVGGDALTATTHISLIIDAIKYGIPVKIVHGSSIITAIAETGLSLYKFGRTVTMPLPEKGPVDTVIRAIRDNWELGLHTLILLDLDEPQQRYLNVNQAIKLLEETGEFNMDTLLVAVARLGLENQLIKADTAENLKAYDFGEAPHAIIVPGQLHFIEEEGLKVLAGCPSELLSGRKVQGEVDRLIEKYSVGCRRVLRELKLNPLPKPVNGAQVDELIDHINRYLDDAEYYWGENNPVALTSVAYAEGVLDALKLLGLVEFEW